MLIKTLNVVQFYQYTKQKHWLGTQAATEEVVTPLCDNISALDQEECKFDTSLNILMSTTRMSKMNKENTVPWVEGYNVEIFALL